MHDRLFEHRHELSDEELRAHATAVGVSDAARFDAELRDSTRSARVEEDLQSGSRSGVPSTPRFFVNGVIQLGAASYGELLEAINTELQPSV